MECGDLCCRFAGDFIGSDPKVVSDHVAEIVESAIAADRLERHSTFGDRDVADVLAVHTVRFPNEPVRHDQSILRLRRLSPYWKYFDRSWRLAFDISGGPKGAKQPLGRPLDGGVRRHVGLESARRGYLERSTMPSTTSTAPATFVAVTFSLNNQADNRTMSVMLAPAKMG